MLDALFMAIEYVQRYYKAILLVPNEYFPQASQ
jgi:hypothetical protein